MRLQRLNRNIDQVETESTRKEGKLDHIKLKKQLDEI